jgi:outer membrane protein with beta-barrel domain
MRRLFLLVALLGLTPAIVDAQPRLLLGGGITAPNGAITDVAKTGSHVQAGLQVDIPTLPLGFRADGGYHRLSEADASRAKTEVLAGSLSVVFTLPGIGLQPYLLGGVGRYRVETGPVGVTQTVTDPGYHGGFGVAIGGAGLGAFVEIRFVQINGATTTRLIPVTIGLRL